MKIIPSLFLFLVNLIATVAAQDAYLDILEIKDPVKRKVAYINLEDRLREGSRVKNCKSVGEGNYNSLLLTYDDGTKVIFKMNDPEDDDPYARYEHEVAAYKLAKYFQIANVPPTVELQLPSKVTQDPQVRNGSCKDLFKQMEKSSLPIKGSAQYFIEGAKNANYNPDYKKEKDLLFFDYLIFNCDRPGNKNLVFKGGKPYFIDNGMGFLPMKHLTKIRKNPVFNKYCDQLLEITSNPKKTCDLVDGTKIVLLRKIHGMGSELMLGNWVKKEEITNFNGRIQAILENCEKKILKSIPQKSKDMDFVGNCSTISKPVQEAKPKKKGSTFKAFLKKVFH